MIWKRATLVIKMTTSFNRYITYHYAHLYLLYESVLIKIHKPPIYSVKYQIIFPIMLRSMYQKSNAFRLMLPSRRLQQTVSEAQIKVSSNLNERKRKVFKYLHNFIYYLKKKIKLRNISIYIKYLKKI